MFLPDLVDSQSLIGDLRISPATFTPNNDGINDRVAISFALFKATGAEPKVSITDLTGRLVGQLVSSAVGDIKSFVWDGRDANGALVAPGIYLCHIDPDADANKGRILRTISIAY